LLLSVYSQFFLFYFCWELAEIFQLVFKPKAFFYFNLLSLWWESLRPIAFFGVSAYFLTRTRANAFFKKQIATENTSSHQESTSRFQSMNGMYWYFDTLCKCTTFRGRAGVAEFWVFYLVNLAICVIPFFCFITWYSYVLSSRGQQSPDCGPLPFLFFLPILFLTPAIAVRRLHDSGKSGWWLLLMVLLFVGELILLVLLLLPSQSGENKYGAR
jgi:uncharacterized membrane protein YhaH (DUF805 family)